MKNFFKRFITFAFATALLLTSLAPTVATFAASQSNPVLVNSQDNLKEYEFQPSLYELKPGETITLSNVVGGGSWYIPAGNKFSFAYNKSLVGNIKMTVYRTSQPQAIVYEHIAEGWGTDFFDIEAQSQAHHYYVTITNVGTQTALIRNYFGFYQ